MESNYELEDIDIKNRTCYYFDDIIKIEDFDLNNILIKNSSKKSGITYIISHNYATIKVDSYNSLPLEKTMAFLKKLI